MFTIDPKKVKHYHEPGDCHELTFSCYHHRELLIRDDWRVILSRRIDAAMDRYDFRLVAFVYMPEHLHLLVYPVPQEPDIAKFLASMKRTTSYQIKQTLIVEQNPLLEELTVQEHPGKKCFRFWQEGPGYDRNINSKPALLSSIDYFHMNPVRRGLCERVNQWKWSSARFYLDPLAPPDPDLPKIHGVPEGYLD